MMAENVVNFPSDRIVREHAGIQLIEDAKEKGLQKFSDTITDDIIGSMVQDLENYGIDIDRDEFLKDFSLVADSLRATIYRHFSINHNLHEFIDSNVKMINRITGEPITIDDVDTDE